MKTKTIITEVSHDDLVNFFSTALYGSEIFSGVYDSPTYHSLPNCANDDCFEDKLAKMLLAGKTIEIEDWYAEDKDEFYGKLPHTFIDGKCMLYTVGLQDVINGFQKAMDDNSYSAACMRNLIDEESYDLDQPQAETIMQYVLFGEQIYG